MHIVYQNAAIEKQRAEQGLPLRHLVAVEGKSFEKDGKRVSYTAVEDYGLAIPDQHFAQVKMPEQALDGALDAGMAPDTAKSAGFQAVWHRQLLDRQLQREKQRAEQKKQVAAQRERKGPGIE